MWAEWLKPMWPRRKCSAVNTDSRTGLVWIPSSVLDRTIEVLRSSGHPEEPHEGVAYWAGTRAGGQTFVTTCIAPAARTTEGSFATSSRTNAEVIMYLASAHLELIGQVHSHPGAFVGHSGGDDRRALMPYEGFLSIVVPSYGQLGMLPLTRCGIHIFENSRFRRMQNAEVESRFRIATDFQDFRTP